MKICKTCRFWSRAKKGFCGLEQRAVGQFWHCESWQAEAPGAAGEAGGVCATPLTVKAASRP